MSNYRSLQRVIPAFLIATFFSNLASADESAWYGRLNGGFTSLGDSDVAISGQAASTAEFDTGSLFGGAIGRQFGPFRVEGEVAYRSNDVSSAGLRGFRQESDAGDFASLGLGVNLLYERNLFGSEKATSYFGGGLVYIQEVDFDLMSDANEEVSFSDSGFGFQLILGARYQIAKDWDLFAEARYFDGGSLTLDSETDSGASLEADYSQTAVVFGVGYRF